MYFKVGRGIFLASSKLDSKCAGQLHRVAAVCCLSLRDKGGDYSYLCFLITFMRLLSLRAKTIELVLESLTVVFEAIKVVFESIKVVFAEPKILALISCKE